MTEHKLKTLTKDAACGVVPGLYVSIRKLAGGSLAKYFVLKVRSAGRSLNLGRYPAMSLAEAFAKASDWRQKVADGIDPVAEEKAKRAALSKPPQATDDSVL